MSTSFDINNQIKNLRDINIATLGGKSGIVTEEALRKAGISDVSVFLKGNKEVSVADAQNAKSAQERTLQKEFEGAQKKEAKENKNNSTNPINQEKQHSQWLC